MAPPERTVGAKHKRETHNNLVYNKHHRKVLVGEVYDNTAMDQENNTKLKYLRGMNTDDELKVDEQILAQIKILYAGDVYKELLTMEKSPYALSMVMPQQALENELGPFPEIGDYVYEDELAKAISSYVSGKAGVEKQWISDRAAYKKDVTKAIGYVTLNHISTDLYASIKKDQPTQYRQIETATNLVDFIKYFKAAIHVELKTHEVERSDTISSEIMKASITDYGCAKKYLDSIKDLIVNLIESKVQKRMSYLSANLTAIQRRERIEEIRLEVTDEVNSNNTMNQAIYLQTLSNGMPEYKRKEYTRRDSESELKKNINQYSRRTLDGVTTGGLPTLFGALTNTINHLKELYPNKKILYQDNKFARNLNINVTDVKEDKPTEQGNCHFCKDKLKTLKSWKNHKWNDCNYNIRNKKCTQQQINDRIANVGKPPEKPPKPPKKDGRQRGTPEVKSEE